MSTIPPPYTSGQHPLVLPGLIGTLFLSLLAPPAPYRRYIFLPPILYLAYRFHRDPLLPHDSAISYSVATLWTLWLRVVVLHLQPEYPESLYRPTWGEKPGDPTHYGIFQKVIWAAHLFSTPRHVGFIRLSRHKPASSSSSPSKSEFLRSTVIRIPLLYLVLDLIRTYLLGQPYTFDSNVTLFSTPLPYRLFDSLVYGISAAGAMQLHYHIGAFISVALGIANSSSWPPLFGHMRDVDSVAGFWRGCWHGMLTETIRGVWEILGLRPLAVSANGDASGKGNDRKSTDKIGMSGIVKVLTAFALSGAGHALAMWTASGSILWEGQMLFFLSQVLVLMMEHAVGWKGKMRGSTQKTKFVGQVWTIAMILWTGVWMADEMGRVGMYRANPVPGSVIRPALRRLGMWDGPE